MPESVKEQVDEMKEKYEDADEERLSAVEAYQSLQTTLEQTVTEKGRRCTELEEKVTQITNQLVVSSF